MCFDVCKTIKYHMAEAYRANELPGQFKVCEKQNPPKAQGHLDTVACVCHFSSG